MIIPQRFLSRIGLLLLHLALPFSSKGMMLFHPPDDQAIKDYFREQEPPKSVLLKLGDWDFHYMDSEKDAPIVVVFVHGSPGGWDAFMPYFKDPKLKDRFRLISVDRLGYGKSSFGKSESSLQKQAEAISAVFDAIDPQQKVILVGHSLGGPIVAQLAIDFPERVDGMLLIAASMDPGLEKVKWYQHPGNWIPFRWIVPDAWRVCNEELLPLKSELTLQQSHLGEIHVPVVVIQGEDDELVPAANADYIQQQLTGAELEIRRYPGLNHFIPFVRRDLVVEGILEVAKLVEEDSSE